MKILQTVLLIILVSSAIKLQGQNPCDFVDLESFNSNVLGQDKYDLGVEAMAIVQIEVHGGTNSNGNPVIENGTGFLINTNRSNPYENPVILTAGHLFDLNRDDMISHVEKANTDLRFKVRYKAHNQGGSGYPIQTFTHGSIISIQFNKKAGLPAADYDFALVQLTGTLKANIPLLGLRPFDNQRSPDIISLHHPSGLPMKVTLSDDVSINNDDIFYTFPRNSKYLSYMRGGTSGAPWFSKNTRVPLAIHKGASTQANCTDGIQLANRITSIWNFQPEFGPKISDYIGRPPLRSRTAFPVYVREKLTAKADMNGYILYGSDTIVLKANPRTNKSRIAYSEIKAKRVEIGSGVTIDPSTTIISSDVVYQPTMGNIAVRDEQPPHGEETVLQEASKFLRLYPNPAKTSFSVDYEFSQDHAYGFRIYDLNGMVIKEGSTGHDNRFIDISGFHQGLYLFRIFESNIPVQTARLIIR